MVFDVKIIHPSNNSDIDVRLPNKILFRDVISQLIQAEFISDVDIERYSGFVKSDGDKQETIMLDNSKTAEENAIKSGDIIQLLISTPSGGFDFTQLWQEIYPYLDQLGTIIEITGAVIGVGTWIKNRFGHGCTPRQFTGIITDKEFWNPHELALSLDITDDEAKNLLKGFGYKWDKHFSLFCKTNQTVEIIEKINFSNRRR